MFRPSPLFNPARLQQNLTNVLPLEPNLGQLPQPRLLLDPLGRLLLLRQLLDHVEVRGLETGRGVVVSVKVYLAQKKDIFATHEKDTVRYVGVQTRWLV